MRSKQVNMQVSKQMMVSRNLAQGMKAKWVQIRRETEAMGAVVKMDMKSRRETVKVRRIMQEVTGCRRGRTGVLKRRKRDRLAMRPAL